MCTVLRVIYTTKKKKVKDIKLIFIYREVYEWVSGDNILIKKLYLLQTQVILRVHKGIWQNKNNKNND